MKITIVTVCYNCVNTLDRTILSVLNQTYTDIEYIIIDGGSKDGTVDIIKKYVNRITYWVSEPDEGVYDAMNKGIAAATGEWINFMNSGDAFYNNEVIENVFAKEYPETCNVIYGKVKGHYNWGTYIKTPKSIEYLETGMILCHQSTFIRTAKHKELPYNLSFKIIADFKFFYTLYKENPNSFVYYSDVIAEYDAIEGISKDHRHLEEETKSMEKKTSLYLNVKNTISNNIPPYLKNIVFRLIWAFDPLREKVKD